MLERGDRVAVGISGGPDSVALAEVMRRVAPRYQLTLHWAHLHHGLRGRAADLDERLVRSLADRWGVPLTVEHVDTRARRRSGQSLEEVARDLRYDFFRRLAVTHRLSKVAVGHHQDDQAETVLMRILRGAGTEGLGGMAPVHTRKEYAVIRPLMGVTRKEIAGWLRQAHLPSREDVSNRRTDVFRNRIRHRVLPMLVHEQPAVVGQLGQLAEVARADEEWMERLTERLGKRLWKHVGSRAVAIRVSVLIRQPVAVQRRLIRWGLARVHGSLRGVGFPHVEAVRMGYRDTAPRTIQLPQGLRAEIQKGRLKLFAVPGPMGGTRSLSEGSCNEVPPMGTS